MFHYMEDVLTCGVHSNDMKPMKGDNMLIKLSRFANPNIKKVVERILASEAHFDNDNRKHAREKISLPISFSSLNNENHHIAFTRDISEKGVCVISPTTFERDSKFKMTIDYGKADKQVREFTGACRWCLPFGESYSISGWFVDGQMDVAAIVQRDAFANWNKRVNDRIKAAIPVEVYKKGNSTPFEAFTRNISGEGACLVTLWPTAEPGEMCLLDMVRGDQRDDIVAKCVWSRPFGNCYISGWQFPRLERIQKFHRRSWPEFK